MVEPSADAARVPPVDSRAAESAVAELLRALGRDTTSEALRDTPRRVVGTLTAMTSRPPLSMSTFANDSGYSELVVVRDIPFHSLCEHHLLPFVGVAHIGYVPGDRLAGLSSLADVVGHYALDLQLQERFTTQVAERLDGELSPRGAAVIVEADQLCLTMRRPETRGALTVTSAFCGVLRDDAALRSEFAARVGIRPDGAGGVRAGDPGGAVYGTEPS